MFILLLHFKFQLRLSRGIILHHTDMILGVKLDSRCFIRDGVTLKIYCVEVVDITYNIQYLRANSLVQITFFITSKMSGFESTEQEALLFCFDL